MEEETGGSDRQVRRRRRSTSGSTRRSSTAPGTGIEDDIEEALDKRGARGNDEAVDLLNNVLLPAMKDVGDRFGRGELILPFVLQSAEVMKKAVAKLEQLPRPDRGAVEGQGRARHRLRRRARHRQEPRQHDPLEQRLHDVRPGPAGADPGDPRQGRSRSGRTRSGCRRCWCRRRSRCRCACTSWTRAACDFPVLIGGAAINRSFGRRIATSRTAGRTSRRRLLLPDAFEGLDTIELLRDARPRAELTRERQQEATSTGARRRGRVAAPADRRAAASAPTCRAPPVPRRRSSAPACGDRRPDRRRSGGMD